MSSVKERITKKAHSDPRVTIDTIHTELIKEMDHVEKSEYYLNNGLLLNEYYSGNILEYNWYENAIEWCWRLFINLPKWFVFFLTFSPIASYYAIFGV